MINFDCKKCIHFPVCAIKTEAIDIIESYDKSGTKESESFKVILNCKYYTNITVSPLNEVKYE